jgi:predicted phage tail protein
MMRTVYLEGEMATIFGPKFEIDAQSPSEVFHCLNANFPTFRKYLMDCHEKDISFECQLAGNYVEDPNELLLTYGKGDMILTPVPSGSKGIMKVIAAVVIAYIMYQTGGMFGKEFFIVEGGKKVGLTMFGKLAFGGTLMLANVGVAEMMAPDPLTDKTAAQEESYLYQGTGQVGKAGDPVPLVYGRLRIPGKPIGAIASNVSRTHHSAIRGADGALGSDDNVGIEGQGSGEVSVAANL